MKQWMMPRVMIEGFAANEYVAACTPVGTNAFTLTCDNDAMHSYGDAQHTDSNPHNDRPITLPNGALDGLSGNKVRWFTESGSKIYDSANLTGTPIPSEAGNAQYIWGIQYNNRTAKKYFYHIYHMRGNAYLEYSGWHVALAGSANPHS